MQNETAPGTVNNLNNTLNERTGLYIAIVAFVIAAMALGGEALQPQLTEAKIEVFRAALDINSNRAQVSENHWRDIEVTVKNQQVQIDKLREELIHVQRR